MTKFLRKKIFSFGSFLVLVLTISSFITCGSAYNVPTSIQNVEGYFEGDISTLYYDDYSYMNCEPNQRDWAPWQFKFLGDIFLPQTNYYSIAIYFSTISDIAGSVGCYVKFQDNSITYLAASDNRAIINTAGRGAVVKIYIEYTAQFWQNPNVQIGCICGNL